MIMEAKGDNMQVEYHQLCALRCYLLFLACTSMFVEKVKPTLM